MLLLKVYSTATGEKVILAANGEGLFCDLGWLKMHHFGYSLLGCPHLFMEARQEIPCPSTPSNHGDPRKFVENF